MTRPARETRVPAIGDLPAYTVRRHPRAKRVRMRVTARDGLVVTLPPRAPLREAARTVEAHRGWAERQLAAVEERGLALAGGSEALLPDEVTFAATGETWQVHYDHTGSASVRAGEAGAVLRVSGAVGDADACLAALRRWLARAARARLTRMLEETSVAQGLPYARATVRAQRSRWGSCSRSGSVSLNRALVFLPPERVRCVLVHELAHLVVHDHSPAFWAELERRSPGCAASRRALRDAWTRVPPWADV